jgi:long-chain acyl-CoA synthetase
MPRRTLLDFFADLATTDGEFLAYDDGYRTWRYRYAEVAAAARAFAERLDKAGVVKGHAVAIWSENRPEWVIALWGCLLRGAVLVPIDYRTSASFVDRVAEITDTRAILVGDVVEPSALTVKRLVPDRSSRSDF